MSISRRPEQIFDTRLVERNKDRGLYDDKSYKKWIKELPDMKENADYIAAVDIFDEAKALAEASEQSDEEPAAEPDGEV